MLVLMITIIWNIYLVSRFLIYHKFFPKMRKRCNIIVMTFKRHQNKQWVGGGQGVPEELSLKLMIKDER